MAGKDPRDARAPVEIPDLDLPPPSAKAPGRPAPAASTRPKPEASPAGDFGMDLERGALSAPSSAMSHGGPQGSIAIGGADEFDMEIERGGAMTSQPPASSDRSPLSSGASSTLSSRPGGSGLDVAYKRTEATTAVPAGPSFAQRLVARLLPAVLLSGTAAALVKLAHRSGGRNLMKLMPHAFDASSTVQSGVFAGGALVLAIALGFIGLKLRPRSYTMVVSAAALVIASLAMVTVTLVSTEEHPAPPDGALLIPYVVPFALFLLGLGIAGRGPSLFLEGGAKRLLAAVAGVAGGAIVFVAIEISAFAARLP